MQKMQFEAWMANHLPDVPLIQMIDAMSVVKRDIMLMIVIAIADEEEAGRDQHLLEDQDLYLFVDHDPLHSDDLDLITVKVKIKIQVYFTTKKQPIKVQISISKKKSFPIRKSKKECKS
ncbi:hypothetical protein QTO34_006671 [Cnephaeus nilssonii]|uniref:Uncharacterized protein n=1 Tax=Cnephaeus nilssonii TaxID=3371016 RepID=A0AA40LIP7_CNENI|nr:hypothetical protein QTO34_006671 [Eptesicus nilssonii]